MIDLLELKHPVYVLCVMHLAEDQTFAWDLILDGVILKFHHKFILTQSLSSYVSLNVYTIAHLTRSDHRKKIKSLPSYHWIPKNICCCSA